MPVKMKVGTSVKEMSNCMVKTNGAWKQCLEVLTKVNGKWVRAWKGDFIDLNVTHTNTTNYQEFEDFYDNLPSVVAFVGLEMSAYNASGVLLAKETLGTATEPEVVSSAVYSLYDDDNMYASINIYVDNLNSVIRYTVSREAGTSVSKIVIKVAKILYNK